MFGWFEKKEEKKINYLIEQHKINHKVEDSQKGLDGKVSYNHITGELVNTFDLKGRFRERTELNRFIMEEKAKGRSFEIFPMNGFGDKFIGFSCMDVTDYVEQLEKKKELKNDSGK